MTMTRDEQKEFVRALCTNFADGICYKIEVGKIPEHWDGHELRQLIADKATEWPSPDPSMSDKRGARRRAYNNDVLVNCLSLVLAFILTCGAWTIEARAQTPQPSPTPAQLKKDGSKVELCNAPTKAGGTCRRHVRKAGDRCFMHKTA